MPGMFSTCCESDDKTKSDIENEADSGSETDLTTEETDTDAVTDETESNVISDTDTEDVTSETTDTTTEPQSEPASVSEYLEEKSSVLRLLPRDILKLEGRHIKAEDFEWALPPVPTLSELTIETANKIKGSDLGMFLKYATVEQRERIFEILPLDLDLCITLPLIEDGMYWKRMCLNSWPPWDLWRFSDSWKSMFVHLTLQEEIENFIPGSSDIKELVINLRNISKYVTSLKLCKLVKAKKETISIDLLSENFDELLDEIISAPPSSIYLNFDRMLESLPDLKDLQIILYPRCIDHDEFHLSVIDFNNLFRGLCKLKQLKKFRISNGSTTEEQMTAIIKLFCTHKYLTELDFSYNFIEDRICDYIGKLLISECPLESLVLKYNKITDVGVKSIAAALIENTKLKKLDLSLNMIEDEGGCFLAKVLRLNSNVIDLDVSKNKMKADSGISFAELVRKSSSLKSLKIQENSFGQTVGKLLSRTVLENNCLLELDVHFCGFSYEDEGSIHKSILRNRLKVGYSNYVEKEGPTASEFLF